MGPSDPKRVASVGVNNSDLEKLKALAADVTDDQLSMLLKIAEAFSRGGEEWRNPHSDIVDEAFAERFRNRLLMYHATTIQKFSKLPFEYAFIEAAKAAGRSASKTASGTAAGADITVDDTTISLKTEAAAKVNPRYLTISKFSEAKRIRDVETRDEYAALATEIVGRHLAEYERMFFLQAVYVESGGQIEGVNYKLVEVPLEMLQQAALLTGEDFPEPTRVGTASVDVKWNGEKAFKLTMDGSVEKIRFLNIEVSQCVVHAEWTIPILAV